MEAFLVSTGLVAIAEMGDKTQLLAFMLSARFRRPIPIVLGITVATLANHALAAAVGTWLTIALGPELLRWLLGVAFIAMGVWVLVPDKPDANGLAHARTGVFTATLVAFFLAEMGDKTQIATVALAAQHQTMTAVVLGTTLGMLIANVPAVLIGERLANRLPVRAFHAAAAAVFVVLGVSVLLGVGAVIGW